MKSIAWAFAILASFLASGSFADDNWPQFRGPGGSGVGSGQPPLAWDVATGRNVVWKTAIAGLGHSAPIVWGDRVFITTAVNSESDAPEVAVGWSGVAGESAKDAGQWTWRVLCLHRRTGEILWAKNAHAGKPAIQRHLKASHANCTPATDGRFVVAFFGSEGLFCFDFQGRLVWRKDFGELRSGPYDAPELEWGFASSPVIDNGKVIVQCDCLNTNFVAILDLETGEEIRRIDRDGEVATWSTPLVVAAAGRRQVVCNGYRQIAGYDLATGERLWSLVGGGDMPVPTPIFANGLIYITNGHGKSPTYAVKPAARGVLRPDEKKQPEGLGWWQPRDGSYMPSPLVLGGLHYNGNDNGRLTVRNAFTGELVYRGRIGRTSGTYSASAVAAAGRIYYVSEAGEVTILAAKDRYEELGRNAMGETVMATPALSGNYLLIRTLRHLYCLASQKEP